MLKENTYTMNYRFSAKEEGYKVRHCFNCGRKIPAAEYFYRNRSMSEDRLISLWQNEILEFYCCLCYDRLCQNLELEEIKDSLLEKERAVIQILEARMKKSLEPFNNLNYTDVGFVIEDGHITELNLFKSGLIKFIPEISELKGLTKLNLSWNYLKCLPENLKQLKNLESIDLIGNHIVEFPKILCALQNLREIDLSFNQITEISPEIINLPHLRSLNLIRNKITHIPDNLHLRTKEGLQLLL